jgi:hypothetical protein
MAAILTIREDGTRGFTVYGPAEENERDVAQQRTRRVVRRVFIQRGRLCVLTRGLSKGQYAVFCIDQSRRRIDFTVLSILSLPSVPTLYHKPYSMPWAGNLAFWLPNHYLSPYGVDWVTSLTSAKYLPSKYPALSSNVRATPSHCTQGPSYSRGPIVGCGTFLVGRKRDKSYQNHFRILGFETAQAAEWRDELT